MKNLSLTFFVVAMILCLIHPASAASENVNMDQNMSELKEEFAEYDNAPYYDAASEPAYVPNELTNEFPKTSLAEWKQGSCGSCWVWTGTALLAQSLYQFTGTATPLSVQFFISNYENGNIGYDKPHDWACTGGSPEVFAQAYTSGMNQNYDGEPFVIPWSNYNASYMDINTPDSGYTQTAQPPEFITTSPNIGFSRITAKRVLADPPTNQTAAVENISTALNDGKVIYYGIIWPNETASDVFDTFFYNEDDTTFYDPDTLNESPYNVTKDGGGHAMVLIGYNMTDTDKTKHYWIIQNSWGTTSSTHPNGQFRLKMWMNYSATFNDPNWTDTQYQKFWIYDVAWKNDPVITGVTPSSAYNTGTVSITNLAGTGFNTTQSAVWLTKTGESDISATDVSVDSSSKIRCAFNLADAAAGSWNIIVTGGDGRSGTLQNGFSIVTPRVDPVPPDSGDNSDSGPDTMDFGKNTDRQKTTSGKGGEITLDLQTNNLGQTLAPYSLESKAGAPVFVSVSVPQATQALAAAGTPIGTISITPRSQEEIEKITATGVVSPSAAAFSALGLAVECFPAGATFDKPVSIAFTMTKSQWDAALEKAGGRYQDITVRYYDPAVKDWVAVPTTVNPTTRTVTGSTSHFSLFAMFINNPAIAQSLQTPATGQVGTLAPQAIATTIPVMERTSAAAVPSTSAQSSGGIPMWAMVAAGIAGALILAGCAFIIRRWWLHRQNPSLFRKFD
ncbi:MAG: C1 family peptidase [Methanoregula sp.]